MLCTPDAYVKVEGMNKRKAAEDFYFLEKLAKIFQSVKSNQLQFIHLNEARGEFHLALAKVLIDIYQTLVMNICFMILKVL